MIADGPPAKRPPHILLPAPAFAGSVWEGSPLVSLRSLKPIILGCALIAGGCDRQSESAAQPKPEPATQLPSGALDRSHKGKPIPDFTVADANGGEVSLPSLAGKPLLVNLWATWCAPCIAELPTLDKIASSEGERLKVITVAEDNAPPEKIVEFLKERGVSALPALIDPESDLSFHYATGTLPTTVLYDAQGKEVWRYVGESDWVSEESKKLIAEAYGSPAR